MVWLVGWLADLLACSLKCKYALDLQKVSGHKAHGECWGPEASGPACSGTYRNPVTGGQRQREPETGGQVK